MADPPASPSFSPSALLSPASAGGEGPASPQSPPSDAAPDPAAESARVPTRAALPTAPIWAPFATLLALGFVQLVAGTTIAWGAIAELVKARLEIGERGVQTIAVCGNVGQWLILVGGSVYDRWGLHKALRTGAVLVSAGYLMMWVCLQSRTSSVVLAIGWFLVGHGGSWMHVSAMAACIKNLYPNMKSDVVSVQAASYVLGPGLWVSMLNACVGGSAGDQEECAGGVIGGDIVMYAATMAFVVPTVALSLSFFASELPEHEGARDRVLAACAPCPTVAAKRLGRVGVAWAGVAGCVGTLRLVALGVPSAAEWSSFFNAAALVAPGVAARRPRPPPPLRWRPSDEAAASPRGRRGSVDTLATYSTQATASSRASRTARATARELRARRALALKQVAAKAVFGDLPPAQCLRETSFWLLVCSFGMSCGCVLMNVNWLGSIADARGVVADAASVAVTIFATFDAMCRVVCGRLMRREHATPAAILAWSGVLAAVAQLCLCIPVVGDTSGGLVFVAALLGASNAAGWTGGPVVTANTYGMRHYGQNWGTVVLCAAVVAVLLSVVVEPTVYNWFVPDSSGHCVGMSCHVPTHIFVFISSVAAAVCGVRLHILLRRTVAAAAARRAMRRARDRSPQTPGQHDALGESARPPDVAASQRGGPLPPDPEILDTETMPLTESVLSISDGRPSPG